MSINKVYYYILSTSDGCFLDINNSNTGVDINKCSDGSEVNVDVLYCTIRDDGLVNDAIYKADFINEIHGSFIVSKKAKEVFEHFSLFKTRFVPVVNKTDFMTIGYALICSNLIDNAIDYDASYGVWHEHIIRDKTVRYFDPIKPVMKYEVVKDLNVFKASDNRFRLFISDRVFDALKTAKLTCWEAIRVKLI